MKHFFIKIIIISGLIQAYLPAHTQGNYYNAANGIASGATLKLALHNIIKGHTSVGYGVIEQYFATTDLNTNGKIWDIYSYKPIGAQTYEYNYPSDECTGNSPTTEGVCFNKEHTIPQSIFNQIEPERSDLHHVYPVDSWVNSKRSNYPYGMVATPTWTSTNGSKLGHGTTYTGYTDLIFEPIDSFKGDLARAYFYMNTRYTTEDNGWDATGWAMATGCELKADAITLLLNWHHLDPVSPKEIARNNAIFAIQNNRNPFIDRPQYADCIWGTANCSAVGLADIASQKMNVIVANNQIALQVPYLQEPFQYQIYNLNGQVIANQNFDNKPINIAQYQPGMYFIKLYSHSKYYYTQFIK